MKLFDFLNNHPDMYADELLYLHALKYCENVQPSQRGDLYYAFLNWKDKHQDVRQRCINLSKVYRVRWIEKETELEQIRYFYAMNSDTYKEDSMEVYISMAKSSKVKYVEMPPMFAEDFSKYFKIPNDTIIGTKRITTNGDFDSIESYEKCYFGGINNEQ